MDEIVMWLFLFIHGVDIIDIDINSYFGRFSPILLQSVPSHRQQRETDRDTTAHDSADRRVKKESDRAESRTNYKIII